MSLRKKSGGSGGWRPDRFATSRLNLLKALQAINASPGWRYLHKDPGYQINLSPDTVDDLVLISEKKLTDEHHPLNILDLHLLRRWLVNKGVNLDRFHGKKIWVNTNPLRSRARRGNWHVCLESRDGRWETHIRSEKYIRGSREYFLICLPKSQ